MDKLIKYALASLVFNILYSLYYVTLSFITSSLWMLITGFYYVILSAIRFVVIRSKKEEKISKFTGKMLVLLSLPVIGTVIMSGSGNDRRLHTILMIAIAAYTFLKISLSVVILIRSRLEATKKEIVLRNISLADAVVSIYSLQRSMLVTFGGVEKSEIAIMNIATGSVACAFVFVLGINLIINKKINLKFYINKLFNKQTDDKKSL